MRIAVFLRRSALLAAVIVTLVPAAAALAAPSAAQARVSALYSGQTLRAGHQLTSPSGGYRAVLKNNGDFVVYGPNGKVRWHSRTAGKGATHVTMLPGGNVVIRTARNKTVWSSSTAPSTGDSLVIANNGTLTIYSGGGLPLWRNGKRSGYSADTLRAGQSLALGQAIISRSGAYRAIMQDDGNFVVYGPKGATWSTGTAGSGATEIIMQDDGNLVIYASGKPVWSSGTALTGGQSLVMQNDGNLIIYTRGELPLWSNGSLTGYSEDTLRAGQSLALGQALVSQSGAYRAIMQDDGNLVIYAPGKPVWSSGTALTGGQSLVMQNDGNLVIYSGGGAALWATQNSDWAGPGFCSSYNVRYTGTTYRGVAACGNADPDNNQGEISYKGVEFDSIGFQCVELAARYLYFITGKKPPLVPRASDYAYYIGADDGFQVYPGGLTGGTTKYQASLTPGQVISMWSASDQIGHVAVVTAVNVSNGNGTITVMDENANGTGSGTIKVSGGTMSYGGYPNFQWTTDLPS